MTKMFGSTNGKKMMFIVWEPKTTMVIGLFLKGA
eukprot:CAMPEP_0116901110 /NCGR_PEP_ID=MMETSP0467-20121206/9127_1 /TAXON_ID=283647 /ORGANISM="Mesodinium pulex, Strain SPMC105" /LENGTH=33 /DNA_ID= /DNA_START= /DNA_END= /DNA_ORIENTATION=